MDIKNIILKVKIAGYILVPAILLLLPAGIFDHGPSICLSKLLAGMECPGCGMTRSIQHMIHFEFKTAFAYNKVSFIVFPILCMLWMQSFIKDVNKLNPTFLGRFRKVEQP